ncbi:hypothetical protein STAS_04057 [Striga asiatica]|uniref:Uncharacterized protein n=1 Tax=Striga asiatica TaxID=4170 RepID=A0A5A7P695_STRAF|nr:hypothetical protein STAS_04057 [Striga asiatica]
MALHNLSMAMFLIVALTLATAEENSQSPPVAAFYDVLSSNGLPIGLFPNGISNFSVDPASGSFRIHLQRPSPCAANFETRLRYETDISGSVRYGRIDDLSGVSAEELFLWLPVKGVEVDVPSSGLIYLDEGVVSKQLSLSLFETPKDCNAVDGGVGNDDVVRLRNFEVGNPVLV